MPPSIFLPAGRDLLGAVVVDGTTKGVSDAQSIGEQGLPWPHRDKESKGQGEGVLFLVGLRQQAPTS